MRQLEEKDAAGLVPLSPSRVSDFKTCPQLFKFRAIDRLPEPADQYRLRGTAVHSVLERLLMLDPHERTLEKGLALFEHVLDDLAQDPESEGAPELGDPEWIRHAQSLLANYFAIEDPTGISPHELEWWVEHPGELAFLRGIIDRVEVTAGGDWILSDYKTGRSPSESYALGAFFGLKFYALVCWRAFGKLPIQLRLVHLKEPEVLTLVPTEQMLGGLERQLEAVARAIARAQQTQDWRPRPGRMCGFCPHAAICPAFATDKEDPAAPTPLPAAV